MRVITIEDVSYDENSLSYLAGCSLDIPQVGFTMSASSVGLQGWVLGRDVPVVAVEARVADDIVALGRPQFPRPDVAKVFPEIDQAERSGYDLSFPASRLTESIVTLYAVLADQTRVPFATVKNRCSWIAQKASPLISVIIPCYRQAHFLADALESVQSQTYPHVEVVVIDDGSPDNTREIANRFPRVRCISQENRGLAAARNVGIQRTLGDFLVFLDADDRLLPKALETGLDCFGRHPDASYVTGQFRVIDFSGRGVAILPPLFKAGDHYLQMLSGETITTPGCVMFRRAVFNHVVGFDTAPRYRGVEDYELYMRIARELPVATHEHLVLEYRRHGVNMSSQGGMMWTSALAAHGDQWEHLGRNRERITAYRAGRRHWHAMLRGALRDQSSRERAAGKRLAALRTLSRLVRSEIAEFLHRLAIERRLASTPTENEPHFESSRWKRAA